MARTRLNIVRAAGWPLLFVLVQACGRPQPAAPEPVPDPCILVDDEPRNIRIALDVPLQPDSTLRAHTPAERFVATQLLQTLVHLDCTGVVRPSLAASWRDSAGLVWSFMLGSNAAYEPRTPIEAADVLRTWTREGHPLGGIFADLGASGSRTVHVQLRAPVRVELFADPVMGMGGDRPGSANYSGWHVAAENPLTLANASGRTLMVQSYAGDLRSAIDDHVDALTTASPSVIAYGLRAGYTSTPLPWSRTYIIATGGLLRDSAVPDEVARSLARDVVGQNARAAYPPFWWEPAPCGLAGVRFRSHDEARDIVYARGDDVARSLAERIAALAWPAAAAPTWLRELLPAAYGAGGAPRAVPLDTAALRRAIRTRLPLAVIVPLPRVYDRECTPAAVSVAPALLSAGWQITALVDARDVLVHRPGIGRVTVDGFGTIRFGPH